MQCHWVHCNLQLWRWDRYPVRRRDCEFPYLRHRGIAGLVRRATGYLHAAPPAPVENIPPSKLSGKSKNHLGVN